MGIFTVRYLKSLLSVLFEYMEYPDYCGEETRMNSLKTLCCLMKCTWPRLVEWMNGWMDGWMVLLIDQLMDRWMNE